MIQALGETAPLLMIGMVAFVVDIPTSPLGPATALPVQIYMWATEAERGFVEKTAGDHRPPRDPGGHEHHRHGLAQKVRTQMVEISVEPSAPDAGQEASQARPSDARRGNFKVTARDVCVFYGAKQALFNVKIDVPDRSVMAFIGPSGCGKTTFLRCINRMNDIIVGARVVGEIKVQGKNIYLPDVDPVQVRARVGMVFQKPNPFPKSIFENVAYGPRIHGLAKSKADLEQIVVTSLKRAGLLMK